MSQWVQSKYSKDAVKLEVVEDMSDKYQYQWVVRSGAVPCGYHFLPKSEYIPCDPPELWETCTRDSVEVDCTVLAEKSSAYVFEDCTHVYLRNGYRWGWSEKDPDALIIQRRLQS